MIEDKFGAELLGLQLPASSPGRLPPLQAAEPTSPPRLHPALPDSCTLCPSPLLHRPGRPLPGTEGVRLALPGGPADFRVQPPPRPPLCPHFSTSPPPQPVARLRCSVPAPSWSLPHLPTPTGRSTGGKRAPGPPDQMAPAVLPKVRGTRGKPGPRRWAVGPGVSAPAATLFFL